MDTSKRTNYKKPLLLALLLLILIIGGCSIWDYYNKGIETETEPVDELQQLIAAKNAGEEVDEDRIEELVMQITKETEAEIETLIDTTDEESDPEAIQAISDQIDQLQTDLLETLEEALDVVEDEEIAEAIEEAIGTVTEAKEAQGDPDQPETVPGEAPGEPVQTKQPEIVPEVPTQNKTTSTQGGSK